MKKQPAKTPNCCVSPAAAGSMPPAATASTTCPVKILFPWFAAIAYYSVLIKPPVRCLVGLKPKAASLLAIVLSPYVPASKGLQYDLIYPLVRIVKKLTFLRTTEGYTSLSIIIDRHTWMLFLH